MIRILLIAILILLIARVFWRLVDGILDATGGSSRRTAKPSVRLVRDPVCGTYVQPRESLSLQARGTTHFFCSEECRSRFRNAPRGASF